MSLRARRSTARLALVASLALACSAPPASTSAPSTPLARGAAPARPPRPSVPEAPVAPLPPSTMPAAERLVAIGDVHGDLDAFHDVLRLAGALDGSGHWAGGTMTVVQTGDLLDRGDGEPEILALVVALEREAHEAGGRFVALIGNHEIMNAQGDFRYVTPDGFLDFASYTHGRSAARDEGRRSAFAPGGRYARELAGRNTIVVIGDTVFVHGGLLAAHVAFGIDAINGAVRDFFVTGAALPSLLEAPDSPVWHRGFAAGEDAETCAALDEALAAAHARRLVIGHTVQQDGVSAICGEHVFRIDVGLARLYGGPLEALEITGDTVRVLRGAR